MPELAHSQQPLPREGVEHDRGRRLIILCGDLDLDAAQRLRPDLCVALNHAPEGIDLDLRDVDFCDCSGLNVLLALRRQAVKAGKTIVIRAASPTVDRVLELTGVRGLFMPLPEAEAEVEVENEDDQDLHTVVAQLRRAMMTRPTIDLARGILMSSFGLSPEAAWEVLVSASQHTNTKLYVLAEDVVGTVRGGPLHDSVRKQLEAAVARTTAAHAACLSPADPRSA
ncbi:anti-sigma factor antagonist [Streptomyces kanamyceticus]|uniref:Anti-sigma factor antagonist n=1 Tax=Streptomyces kanamyceticus TaxID=1967 RepID=A0A5J6G481_STRKN|nr:anti-sigma factor antagonist [Streptomyces kanamyceticus]QEU89743.1 STAS domain-containing protein [Streptomyces kanamyceticus]